MVHHELVGEVAAVLGVADFLVHEAVDQRDAAVDGEGRGQLLVGRREGAPARLVAQLGDAQHLAAVQDRDAQNVPATRPQTTPPTGLALITNVVTAVIDRDTQYVVVARASSFSFLYFFLGGGVVLLSGIPFALADIITLIGSSFFLFFFVFCFVFVLFYISGHGLSWSDYFRSPPASLSLR